MPCISTGVTVTTRAFIPGTCCAPSVRSCARQRRLRPEPEHIPLVPLRRNILLHPPLCSLCPFSVRHQFHLRLSLMKKSGLPCMDANVSQKYHMSLFAIVL